MSSFLTVRAAVTRWKPADSDSREGQAKAANLIRLLDDKPLSRFTVGDVQRHVAARKKQGISNRTANLELTLLRSLFRYAVDNGIVTFNPAARVKNLKVPKRDREVISREQFAALVEAAEKTRTGKGLALWVAMGGMTGMRPTESLTLEWRDVMWDDNRIMVRPKMESPVKTGAFRAVPIAEELRPRLTDWRAEWERRTAGLAVGHDWVFIHWHDPARRTLCFRTAFEKAVATAMIERLTPYDLRHFFITECVKQHLSLVTIAKWVGHSSLTMINDVYAHLDDGFHQEEMRRASFTA
ncbi:tyrosine recombinase XerC [Verrucomicrobiota bacterium]